MFSYKEARSYVKSNLNGKRGKIFGYFILYSIFRSLISAIISFNVEGYLALFMLAAVGGVLTPMQVGFYRIMRNILENKEPKFEMLFNDYKYFVKLFVIGFVFSLLINIGYKLLYIPGVLISIIYIGVLYFFVYNSELSLGEFASKIKDKIGSYFGNAIMLEISYAWILLLVAFIYTILVAIFGLIFSVKAVSTLLLLDYSSIDAVISSLMTSNLVTLLIGAIPLLIISLIFVVVAVILTIIILPRILLAEAKFYSVFSKEEKKSKTNYCPNCGAKINGKFCQSCGEHIKE